MIITCWPTQWAVIEGPKVVMLSPRGKSYWRIGHFFDVILFVCKEYPNSYFSENKRSQTHGGVLFVFLLLLLLLAANLNSSPFCFVISFCCTLPSQSHTLHFLFWLSLAPSFSCLIRLSLLCFFPIPRHLHYQKNQYPASPFASETSWVTRSILPHIFLWLGGGSFVSSSWFLWEAWLLFMV